MCGIAGVIGYERMELKEMLVRIRHRGPDHTEVTAIQETRCLLGHVRLSIIDLDPRSHQPFVSQCGRYVLVFNGEIYNFRELKAELEAKGVVFRTTSDTEVLLHWLIRHGTGGLERLEGMFSFAFADGGRKTLLLVRDPIGEKPLYYATARVGNESRFAFASEIKGLLALPGIDRSLDRDGLLNYVRFLYTAPPHTLYHGIRELAPGNYLEIDLAATVMEPQFHPYYMLERSIEFTEECTTGAAAKRFGELFERSVRLRLVSDVNIGLFLSAGMDSNAILAAAQSSERSRDLHTYTLEYSPLNDESRIVRGITERQGLPNVAIPFTSLDFHASLARVVDLFDQPFGNATAIVSDMIAAEAHRTCKVCLVGDGGDELAVGYPRYHALRLSQRFRCLPVNLRKSLAAASSRLPETGRLAVALRRGKQFLGTLEQPMAESFLDWSTYVNTRTLSRASGITECETPFYKELLSTFSRHSRDPIRAATIVDMKSFVPFNLMQSADRTSMAHSLELRSPFLATPLVHAILGMPSHVKAGRGSKPLIREALGARMPKEVLKQPKRPFNPPIRELVRRNIDVMSDYILRPTARLTSVLDAEFVRNEMAAFRAGRRDNSTFLWGLATLEHWLRRGSCTLP